MSTVKLTMAQALVRYLAAQKVEVDGEIKPLFSGVWAIFGHGNVPALGEALSHVKDVLPTYRGQCEQSMAHAAIAYAKQTRRQQMMVASSSIGPGATNMVTAAALAHVNRLPVLLLPGDTFQHRRPDPVLQQVECLADPTITVNDCFKPVSAYFDRITKPEQLITSLPNAIAVLTDPERCGPATLAMPQDVQAEFYDFPETFFSETVHYQQRIGADQRALNQVAEQIKAANKPVIIAGGGVHYSDAVEEVRAFAIKHGVPVVETSAGRGAMQSSCQWNAGGVGVVGSESGNTLVQEADLLIAIGTRLSDFTTGSRTVISNAKTPQININVVSFDAQKHGALALRSDAKRALLELAPLLQSWRAESSWGLRCEILKQAWAAQIEVATAFTDSACPSDAQVTKIINDAADPHKDVLVVAAGSMPAEGMKIWQSEYSRSYHSEYGFSCMGYEIAGGIGVKMADPEANVFVVVGDGSYLMLNSEITSSVMLNQKIIIVVLDNRGFGCINRLQGKCGAEPFNNLIDDGTHQVNRMPKIDYAAHAKALGAESEFVSGLSALKDALVRAKRSSKTYLIAIDTNAEDSTGGGVWWQVGIPEVSTLDSVVDAQQNWQLKGEKNQAY